MKPAALTLVCLGLAATSARAAEPPAKKDPTPSAADRSFWAFQAPRRPAVPEIRTPNSEIRNPIDAFLLVKLRQKGLGFNPEAPKEVLLRRACFDLTGLPPSPALAAEFFHEWDARPQAAYEKLIDKLLDLPAYGERWGRHWLDVAGYADSDGYLDADRLRPQAWRYRDYVIQAHNADLPYDRFLTEQLAGDELSDWRRAEEFTPETVRQLTATGFLRNALDPTYPGYTEPNEIHQVLSDTMQIVGSTFLGLTVQCAKCHNHKQDPISQKDYYALQAVFLPALDPARWQPSEVRGIPLAPEAEVARIKEHNQKVAGRVAELNTALAQLTERHRKKAGNPKATEAELAAKFPEYKAELEKLKAAVAAESALKKDLVLLRGLTDLDGRLPEARVLMRGDYTKLGEVVSPGVPEVLAPVGFRLDIKAGNKTSGRRLALARWLTDPQNPLTARVQVNRMWALHFGRGLVPTVANFGRAGAKPSHPELLDWLACEFIDQKWSMKQLHRLIMTSAAYRQSSAIDEPRKKYDPNNELLSRWKPRRLEGEAVRDTALAVAGKLSEERFGPPAQVIPKGDGSVDTADDAQGNRRSVYLIVRRSKHLTLLDLLDVPMMEVNCPQRPLSTVPLQALALLNSPFSERNAAAFAARILKEGGATDEARIAYAFRLAFTREPRPEEAAKVKKFLAAVGPRDGWPQVALVLLNSNEFVYLP
jgi:hypothetical protein